MGLFDFLKNDKEESKMNALSNSQTSEIFMHPSLTFHFVEERDFPDDFAPDSPESHVQLMTGKYNTGKFHLILKLTVPENITGISRNNQDIFQEWELIRVIKSKTNSSDGVYEFKAWGRTPCVANDFTNNSHHEGKIMYIDREFFETKIIASMYMSDNFDDDTLKNTIGFELVKFK